MTRTHPSDPATGSPPERKRTVMILRPEESVRAHMEARLSEAELIRRDRHIAMARRVSRKAERAALQARLAIARAL